MHHASAIDDNGSNFCYYHVTTFWANYLIFLTLRKVLKFMIVSCCNGNASQSYNEKYVSLSTTGLTLEMLIENEGSGLVVLCSRVAVG